MYGIYIPYVFSGARQQNFAGRVLPRVKRIVIFILNPIHLTSSPVSNPLIQAPRAPLQSGAAGCTRTIGAAAGRVHPNDRESRVPNNRGSRVDPNDRGSRVHPNNRGQPGAAWSEQEVCSGFALAAASKFD
jgi:hypothetical protein